MCLDLLPTPPGAKYRIYYRPRWLGGSPLREIWGGLKEMTQLGGAVASEKGDRWSGSRRVFLKRTMTQGHLWSPKWAALPRPPQAGQGFQQRTEVRWPIVLALLGLSCSTPFHGPLIEDFQAETPCTSGLIDSIG